MPRLLIGLMSGTSLDGIDGVLATFPDGAWQSGIAGSTGLVVHAHAHQDMPTALRAELLRLNSTQGPDELHRAALAANALARLQADVVAQLLATAGVPAQSVAAVGSHGQTVRHRPGEFDGLGYTLQLNNGALLAELCGIDVVCDFRSRDVAAGGQAAPLVPAFHAALFGASDRPRAVLNLGGIANLTLLPARGAVEHVRGYDCGPANVLLDIWAQRHFGVAYDDDGRISAGVAADAALLAALMAEPYLQRPAPKSTGRDLFDAAWLDRHVAPHAALSPRQVQATLAEFTAAATADALLASSPNAAELLVCGGGALNSDLMQRLAARLPGIHVRSTATAGLPPLQMEATAFAWLAGACLQRSAGNVPAVTGAAGPRVLGAIYPAK